ncbi:MAG: ATP-binding protein [Pseudomonadota bacterium]
MTSDFSHPHAEPSALIDQNWSDVLSAVDATYAELVAHQSKLENQNQELDAFRRLFTSILESIKDVMVVLDRDGLVQDASASLEHIMGAETGGLRGRSFQEFFSGADRDTLAGTLEWLRLSKGRMAVEASIQGQEGSVPFDFGISGRYDARRRLIGAVVLGHPLGELRQAYSELAASHDALKSTQAQLVRNEKLAGLGRLLAGVAHELNNPISFVYANAHALERYIGRFETYFAEVESGAARERLIRLREELRLDRALRNLRSAIDGAKDGSERVRDIVDDLRRLSSDGAKEAEPFDLVEVSRVAARWVERGSKSGIMPRFEGAETLQVIGNPGHVQQIVMNLVQNAMDALKQSDDPQIVISIEDDAETARLTVSDNGPGIPAELARSVFDPFFTTKPVGQGTGLGLAICHKIAEEHGGTLTLGPSEVGSAFCLTLPRGDAAPAASPGGPQA